MDEHKKNVLVQDVDDYICNASYDSVQVTLNELNKLKEKVKNIKNTKKELIKRAKDHRDALLEELAKAEMFIDQAENIQFEKGDIVYHKAYGACIVQGISLNSRGIFADYGPEGVVVKIAHSEGSIECSVNEIVPKTKMSETLYE